MSVETIKSTTMFNGLVVCHSTESTKYPGQILYEFRLKPDKSHSTLDLKNWDDHNCVNPKIRKNIPLPLYDLDIIPFEDFHRIVLTPSNLLRLDGKYFTSVFYQKHRLNHCVNLDHQTIRPPYPVSDADPEHVFPLMTFDEAKECIRNCVTKEQRYYAFGNTVVAIVNKVRTFAGKKFRTQRIEKSPSRLTKSLVNELMSLMNRMYHIVHNYTTEEISIIEMYRAIWLITNIKKKFNWREEDLEFKFIYSYIDFINVYMYISGYSMHQSIIDHEKSYLQEYHSIDSKFIETNLRSLIFDFKVIRPFDFTIYKENQVPPKPEVDHLAYMDTIADTLNKRYKKLIKEFDRAAEQRQINKEMKAYRAQLPIDGKDLVTKLEWLIYKRERPSITKKQAAKLDKAIAKENARLMRVQKTDVIWSPRVRWSSKIFRILGLFKKALPSLIGPIITGILGALSTIFIKPSAEAV